MSVTQFTVLWWLHLVHSWWAGHSTFCTPKFFRGLEHIESTIKSVVTMFEKHMPYQLASFTWLACLYLSHALTFWSHHPTHGFHVNWFGLYFWNRCCNSVQCELWSTAYDISIYPQERQIPAWIGPDCLICVGKVDMCRVSGIAQRKQTMCVSSSSDLFFLPKYPFWASDIILRPHLKALSMYICICFFFHRHISIEMKTERANSYKVFVTDMLHQEIQQWSSGLGS